MLTALRQTGAVKNVSQKNLADALAARSAKVLTDIPDRAREAALLAIESDRLNPSFEANEAFRAASGTVFAMQRDRVTQLYSLPGQRQTASLDGPDADSSGDKSGSQLLRSADHCRLLAFETTALPHNFFIDIWSPTARARVSLVTLPAEFNRAVFNPSGSVLFTSEGEPASLGDSLRKTPFHAQSQR